jgi:hypothetical protein
MCSTDVLPHPRYAERVWLANVTLPVPVPVPIPVVLLLPFLLLLLLLLFGCFSSDFSSVTARCFESIGQNLLLSANLWHVTGKAKINLVDVSFEGFIKKIKPLSIPTKFSHSF